nr:hypothetical protein [Synechococcus sp. CBW1006]
MHVETSFYICHDIANCSGCPGIQALPDLLPPLPRQLPRRRRRQHCLAKALEDRRHAIEPLAAGLDSGEGGVELGGNAALFVEGGKGKEEVSNIRKPQANLRCSSLSFKQLALSIGF